MTGMVLNNKDLLGGKYQMKTTKHALLIFVTCLIILSPYSYAASPNNVEEMQLANKLKTLTLFKGVSDTDFALEKNLTRTEAIVLTLRLLGLEEDAINCKDTNPFEDVPNWADKYISYAYNNGITNGISESKFGNYNIPSYEFITLILRTLEYSDSSGDFSWNTPYNLAKSINLIDSQTDLDTFIRADSVRICYKALDVKMKQSKITLSNKLINNNVFTKDAFDKIYTELTIGESDSDSSNNDTITSEEAENIALAYYNISRSEISSINSSTYHNLYVVVFTKGEKQYFVKVHQTSKEVKEAVVQDLSESNTNKPNTNDSNNAGSKISQDNALKAVLYYFSLEESNISDLEVTEDNLFYYFDFKSGDLIFNVKINSYTNEISLYEKN